MKIHIETIRIALSSPSSLFFLTFGSFSLASMIMRYFSIELAPVITTLIDIYRVTISAFFDFTLGKLGITLSELQKDLIVIWLALGRITSRCFYLLREELHADSFLTYDGFYVMPHKLLDRVLRHIGHLSNGKLYRFGSIVISAVIFLLWPMFIWILFVYTTMQKTREEYHPMPEGTPHPSGLYRGARELPRDGDYNNPKFSKITRKEVPKYYAPVIVASYCIISIIAVFLLLGINAALQLWNI